VALARVSTIVLQIATKVLGYLIASMYTIVLLLVSVSIVLHCIMLDGISAQ